MGISSQWWNHHGILLSESTDLKHDPNSFPSSDNNLISKDKVSSHGWGLVKSVDNGPAQMAFVVGCNPLCNGNEGAARYSASTITTKKWYHFVGVYNAPAQTMDIYVNGSLDDGVLSRTPSSAQTNSTANVYMGQSGDGINFWSGQIDDVRIYNRALSPSEVKRLYNMGGTLHVGASQNQKITNGLVGLWSFDQADIAGVKAYDRSGNGNDGTLTNGPKQTIGKIGQALSFAKNSTQIVSLGNPTAIQNLNQKTITAWIYPKGAGGNGDGRIIETQANLGAGYSFNICDSSDGSGDDNCATASVDNVLWFGQYWSITNSDFRTAANTIKLNQWQFVAVSYDQTSASNIPTFYINGAVSSTIVVHTPQGAASSDASMGIGNRETSLNRAFDGTIDDFRIYNRALSPSEVKRLYNIGQAN